MRSAPVSLREYLLLSYAESLRADPGLWRVTVDYMCTCGEAGKNMADQVLLGVPLWSEIGAGAALDNPEAISANQADDVEMKDPSLPKPSTEDRIIRSVQTISAILFTVELGRRS